MEVPVWWWCVSVEAAAVVCAFRQMQSWGVSWGCAPASASRTAAALVTPAPGHAYAVLIACNQLCGSLAEAAKMLCCASVCIHTVTCNAPAPPPLPCSCV